MIYVGVPNNWTAGTKKYDKIIYKGHLDICGSLVHNIMVYTDPNAYALWFMVATADR